MISDLLQELEAVFDSAYSGIVAINKQGIITSLNPAAEGPTRSTRDKAVGRSLNDVIIPDGLLDMVRTGIPQFGVKFQVGKRKYITNRTPILKHGEVVGAVGVFQDISQLELISQELETVKNLHDELRIIVDSTGDGIIVCNARSEIIRCNSAVEKILGTSRDKFMGQSSKNIVYLVKTQGGPKTILEKNKAGRSLIINGTPVYDDEGEMNKIVINIRDISESLELRRALEQSKLLTEQYQSEIAQIRNSVGSAKLIFQSSSMKKVLHIVQRVSSVHSPVALIGEDGVGKHELAKLIHAHSRQKDKHFVTVNCKAIPENILKAQLAGDNHGRDLNNSKGLLHSAEVGTIFFEDIGSMSHSFQLKILDYVLNKHQTVQDKRTQNKEHPRIIIGSDKPLREYVDTGLFNEQLFFALNVIPIRVPPLIERKEDILPLLGCYLSLYCKKYSVSKKFSQEATDFLLNYRWPGNIRELVTLTERLTVTSPGDEITLSDVSSFIEQKDKPVGKIIVTDIINIKSAVEEVEHKLLTLAMNKYGSTTKLQQLLA